MFFITKEFTFDAAHFLSEYHGKCENLHGHTYKLHVTVEGERDNEGMVLDFLSLKLIVKEHILSILDHSNLNDIFIQPSAENIIYWIWEILKDKLRGQNYNLSEMKLWETPTSFVTYRGD
ncbi:6-carboxytetrahydropterin synthase QueD [Pleomorphochaeta sp. DL1XJH-081]|jgi:6-pyruvoyltetrahydropterin/6-carboxytetrahydropterin synthase|uniref:6-carboxytetrahydropterin synthase QueD n=1 Tax=Pleomorphochaeta sp. DL1XJH-081 TaxID=3409690 RepID=UPI003BB711E1